MHQVAPAFLLLGLAAAAENGYVPALTCKPCHPKIYESYRQTGMGRSFYRIESAGPLEDWKRNHTFDHSPSERHYTVSQREGKFFVRRHQIGCDGAEVNVVEKRIDYVIGSGNHSRTYLHRTPAGSLVELPVSWYSADGGHWAMSPGYEGPAHQDFRRVISDDCLFCHNGYPAAAPGGIAEGIDCQRCHGPGREHASSGRAGAILSPARLSARRQLEICMQCHLETTSRMLPNAVRRYDRPVFSYRPGEPLAGYMIHFDHPQGSGHEDKFEVNHAAYRLRKSACYLRNQDFMTCTTCHNPHAALRGREARQHYSQVCHSCHKASRHFDNQDCTGCHMPKRGTDDAPHIVMTDHWIRRRPASHSPETGAYSGKVDLYYPPDLPNTPENRLYLAIAQVKDFANLDTGIPLLRRAIAEYQPKQGQFYLDLAEAYWKTGRRREAIEYYDQAIHRSPDLVKAFSNFGEVLLRDGQLSRSVAVLEQGLKTAPREATIPTTLAVAYGQQGRMDEAVALLLRAVEINPDLPAAWFNLAVAWEQEGNRPAAEAAYRNAIRVQPDFAEAHERLEKLAGNPCAAGPRPQPF
jgi:predicted CXXCH cytochrome family protein